jgi:zinc transporter 1/2/3
MNCPSRTDPETLANPQYNQNPSVLAGDITTCQDLNGISNAREHKVDTGLLGDSWACPGARRISQPDGDPENPRPGPKGASLTRSGNACHANRPRHN